MIVVEPCAGLGNRFLGLASAYYWSLKTGDELAVLWKTERVMGAESSYVFTLPGNVKIIKAKDYGFKDKPFSFARYRFLEKHFRKKAVFFTDVEDTMAIFEGQGNAGFEEALCKDGLKFIRAYSQFYDFSDIDNPLGFIMPSGYVRDKAAGIVGGISADKNIGVHIRRGDNRICIDNSPLDVFVTAMEKEIARDDGVTFYIASDDADTIAELKSRFGDRIYYMAEKCFERDSNLGIADAFAELICLSHSRKIIGSFYSTYSRIAAMLSGIELEIVKKTCV